MSYRKQKVEPNEEKFSIEDVLYHLNKLKKEKNSRDSDTNGKDEIPLNLIQSILGNGDVELVGMRIIENVNGVKQERRLFGSDEVRQEDRERDRVKQLENMHG
ncbi:MAG: hypothetical protein EZS28_006049 [Streblomastix strix]|uniref:Uncharacterized protein n=1 Tax=Streblomastix strix TaxID=222440 RepID=A0A5J4WTR9_9EUKA|nr:MAG: hypothetical protein EZS28_006049 [Streblomastix strix]